MDRNISQKGRLIRRASLWKGNSSNVLFERRRINVEGLQRFCFVFNEGRELISALKVSFAHVLRERLIMR